jgi:queuine tRNA-ribosyltransferase
MFANTYHLMVQPGEQHIENAGGLHEFINRRTAPLITDSGGFQIFSLGAATDKRESSDSDSREMKTRLSSKHKSPQSLIKSVTENGVVFKSYRDGKIMELTPESSVAAQKRLGADIIIPLDELPPYAIDADALKESLFRSHRWEARSLRAHLNDKRKQAMYAVIHGGVDDALRKTSCEYLTSLPFDGFAIGGSLGKNTEELVKMLTNMMPLLPKDRPNHLLGIGDEVSIRKSVGLGVDAFDSTFPTRSARHGSLLTRTRGRVNIRNAKNKSLHEPPCFECACPLCTNHTMAYLHHLDRAREPMAWTLATEHNLWYMGYMMREIRGKIARDEL